ncbi:MAG: DUF6745 domain-containing protein, partial [Paracoccaceae bacterium]
TRDATDAATDAATRDATFAGTRAATFAATDTATRDATFAATRDATDAATACFDLSGIFGLMCAQRWPLVYQGGNMWASWDSYLCGMRDVIGLSLPEYADYEAWEAASRHGGFRVMHPEFCIVSDFPELIRVDEQNRPHCEFGPSHRWRDGWELYHWHGTRVPDEWILDKDFLTPQIALSQENTALRIAAMEILGWPKIIDMLEGKVVNRHPEGLLGGELIAIDKAKFNPDETGVLMFLKAECPRNGIIAFRVPDDTKTAHQAQAWKAGLPPDIYQLPTTRT